MAIQNNEKESDKVMKTTILGWLQVLGLNCRLVSSTILEDYIPFLKLLDDVLFYWFQFIEEEGLVRIVFIFSFLQTHMCVTFPIVHLQTTKFNP